MTDPSMPPPIDGWASPSAGPPTPPPPPLAPGWGPPPMSPKPGVVALRPLGVGEILDGAITTMRRYPKPMLGLTVVVVIALHVVQFILLTPAMLSMVNSNALASPDATVQDAVGAMGPTFTAAIATGLIAGLGQLLLSGVLTVVVAQAVLGQPVSAAGAWQRLKPQVWRLLGLAGLVVAIALGVAAITIGLFVLFVALLGGFGVLLGVALLITVTVGWIIFTVRWAVAACALILEKCGPITALRRSWAVIEGGWWRTLGVLLLVYLLSAVIGGVISVPFSIVGSIAQLAGTDATGSVSTGAFLIGQAITTVGQIIAATITYPFVAACLALIYIDRRMRREGLDIELARAAGYPVP